MGDRDFTRQVLEERSGGMKFWKIAMKPGKPLAFGVAKDGKKQTPLIGLPGNPASSLVCFHQFVKPALARLQGVNWHPAVLEATTTEALTSTPISNRGTATNQPFELGHEGRARAANGRVAGHSRRAP